MPSRLTIATPDELATDEGKDAFAAAVFGLTVEELHYLDEEWEDDGVTDPEDYRLS